MKMSPVMVHQLNPGYIDNHKIKMQQSKGVCIGWKLKLEVAKVETWRWKSLEVKEAVIF